MDAIYDDGSCIVHQSVWALVRHGRVCLVYMTQDVLIALDTIQFTVFVFSVELCANILPGGGGQDVACVIYDR